MDSQGIELLQRSLSMSAVVRRMRRGLKTTAGGRLTIIEHQPSNFTNKDSAVVTSSPSLPPSLPPPTLSQSPLYVLLHAT